MNFHSFFIPYFARTLNKTNSKGDKEMKKKQLKFDTLNFHCHMKKKFSNSFFWADMFPDSLLVDIWNIHVEYFLFCRILFLKYNYFLTLFIEVREDNILYTICDAPSKNRDWLFSAKISVIPLKISAISLQRYCTCYR